MRIPAGIWSLVKEVARHLLRRPVVGVALAARAADGRWLLVRRTDTGQWAFPGGTLEWGETLREAAVRELREETGVVEVELGALAGVYSAPDRDRRFHAVTVLVHAIVGIPTAPPANPIEIASVALFSEDELPAELAHGMTGMLADVRGRVESWE